MTPPVFAHGHLRLYLLSLLAESDSGMHGYELIQALGDRFGGTYVPSAGTIYPRLAKLEEEGLVSKLADGRKTVYAITDAGRAELAERQSELDGIEDGVTDSVRRLADEVRTTVNDAMRTLRADLAAAARDARTQAKDLGQSIRADSTEGLSESRLQLQHAEAVLSSFRAAVRSDLRVQVSRGELSAATVEQLTRGLDEVRSAVKASLG
jgi:DNA-binding PadR family transcriptional regulator